MPIIALPFEQWRAVIDVLREKNLSYMVTHADAIEQQRDQHAPDEPVVSLSLSDDAYLRSYKWARWQLGIPLPPMEWRGQGWDVRLALHTGEGQFRRLPLLASSAAGVRSAQTRNGPMPSSGAMSHTRHHASPSSSVLP